MSGWGGFRGLGVGVLVGVLSVFVAAAADRMSDEELFRLASVQSEPLDGRVMELRVEDGIVIERVEFTTRTVGGVAERVEGVFAYPEGAHASPAVFWSMGGMAKAGEFFPVIFAKKGYACLAITLPHAIRDSRAAFDVENPKEGNFTLLARDQMRGITYLSQRKEVDSDLIAVGGASYGGVFATLIAGIDPRVKAGMSFFGGGHHAMGTNLPQFTKLQTGADVARWNQTVDPAFRHTLREVPFLWAVAFNDNWFHFPAVIRTYEGSISAESRLVIMPWWRHGFPANIDRQIADFPDTVMTKSRPVYNRPGPIKISNDGGRARVWVDWSGANPVRAAELIVSYGEVTEWLGWLHRACFVFPAQVEGKSASAELPIPSNHLPLLAWMNISDDRDVVTSSVPVVLDSGDLAEFASDPQLELNCFPDAEFGPAVVDFYEMSGEFEEAEADSRHRLAGVQSLRVDPPADGKPTELQVTLLHNVPGLGHRFSIWVRADQKMRLAVTLTPVRPANWNSPVVAELVRGDSRLAPLLPRWKSEPQPITVAREIGPDWVEVRLEVPKPVDPVEGYLLTVQSDVADPFWVDLLRMEPVWP